MKPQQAIYGLFGVSFVVLASCTVLRSNQQTADSTANPTTASPTESPSPSPSPSSEENRPDTRVMPMTIEGKIIELELRLFDQPRVPFTTYVPTKDFQNEVTSSKTGTVAQFFFSPKGKKDETAYVQIFLPTQQTSIEDMRGLLLDNQGLLASNNWELVDRTDIVSYPWAREKLIYQQQSGKRSFIGSIYIGDYDGRSFYALTHYPAEYSNGFEPRSTIMLENLQFRDDHS